MIELHRRVFLVPGKNRARFPYCNGLYLRGKKLRVLIDAGMGKSAVRACRREGLDLLILSHCHIDHRLSAASIPEVPVWAHEKEVPYLEDHPYFVKSVGFDRGGFDLERLFPGILVPLIKVQKRSQPGSDWTWLGLTLEMLPTPGHTPGHLAFFVPEADFLFTADIDLTPFGPFYGHDFADIDTGHAGPFSDRLAGNVFGLQQVIYQLELAAAAGIYPMITPGIFFFGGKTFLFPCPGTPIPNSLV